MKKGKKKSIVATTFVVIAIIVCLLYYVGSLDKPLDWALKSIGSIVFE